MRITLGATRSAIKEGILWPEFRDVVKVYAFILPSGVWNANILDNGIHVAQIKGILYLQLMLAFSPNSFLYFVRVATIYESELAPNRHAKGYGWISTPCWRRKQLL